MKIPQKKGLGNGLRKWEVEKGPPKDFAWGPRGLNQALHQWLSLHGWPFFKFLTNLSSCCLIIGKFCRSILNNVAI